MGAGARIIAGVTSSRPAATGAVRPGGRWERVRNPGGFIHGALVAGTTLAVASTAEDTVRQTVAATAVVLVIYWATHAYTEALGERIADPHAPPSRILRAATRHER